MQRLHIGVCLQAARQEIDAPTDHREGVCVDHGPSAIKDMIPVFEVAVQDAELLCDQLLSCLDHRLLSGFVDVGRVAGRHEDWPEGGVNVRGEEG